MHVGFRSDYQETSLKHLSFIRELSSFYGDAGDLFSKEMLVLVGKSINLGEQLKSQNDAKN